MTRRCDKCEYWSEDFEELGTGDLRRGECRRYPPSLFDSTDENGDTFTSSFYPMTYADFWCGEYRSKEV